MQSFLPERKGLGTGQTSVRDLPGSLAPAVVDWKAVYGGNTVASFSQGRHSFVYSNAKWTYNSHPNDSDAGDISLIYFRILSHFSEAVCASILFAFTFKSLYLSRRKENGSSVRW